MQYLLAISLTYVEKFLCSSLLVFQIKTGLGSIYALVNLVQFTTALLVNLRSLKSTVFDFPPRLQSSLLGFPVLVYNYCKFMCTSNPPEDGVFQQPISH